MTEEEQEQLLDPLWYEDEEFDPLEIFRLPVGDPGPDQGTLF